jgi:hypothetical protein
VSRRSLSETVGPVVYQRIGLVHKVNGPPAAAGRDPHRHRRHKNHQTTTASSHTLQKYAELPGLSNLVVSVFSKDFGIFKQIRIFASNCNTRYSNRRYKKKNGS